MQKQSLSRLPEIEDLIPEPERLKTQSVVTL